MADQPSIPNRQASYEHVFRHDVDMPGESAILSQLLTSESDVLDVGTGATGRSAKLAKLFGPKSVVSIEINPVAAQEFAASASQDGVAEIDGIVGIELAIADFAALPFERESFDIVLVAFHGMDYILEPETRAKAISEAARVLRPGGRLILNSWNRLGILFTPYQLKSLTWLKLRAIYVLRGDVFRQTLTDANGLQLHQSTPRAAIAEVESASDLKLEFVIDSFAKSRNMAFVSLTSMEPYCVFRRPIEAE